MSTPKFFRLTEKAFRFQTMFYRFGKNSRLKQVCLFGVVTLLFYICNKLTRYNHEQCGLDLYDYGARLYDPAAAFWTSPDPLCEKYYNISPYAFCNNNPVTFIDPDGRVIRIPKNQKKIVRYINRLAQGIFDVDKNGYLYLKKKTNTQGFSSYYTKK